MCVEIVERVLEHFNIFHTVENIAGGLPRTCNMPAAHVKAIIGLVSKTLWLYLDEISLELEIRFGVNYLPGLCWSTLKRHGHSLQTMRRKVRQR